MGGKEIVIMSKFLLRYHPLFSTQRTSMFFTIDMTLQSGGD